MADLQMMNVTLTRDFMTNGKLITAGHHTLPKDEAEDLQRRQAEWDRSRARIHETHNFIGNAGTISMGGGAES